MYEDEVIETILESRGVTNPEHFFYPTAADLLPLDSLTNIDKAAGILCKAVLGNEKILVFFDTDLDGVSSGTILTRFLKGCNVDTYIDEGKQHGFNGQDLSYFYNYNTIFVVDSLDNTIDNYKDIAAHGVKIVVLDHHAINPQVPYDDYVCLVSSQRNYGNPALSGAGVVWKFCKYYYEKYGNDVDPDCLIDLAACGIVGDMMDMTNMENRYIVSKGLEQIYNPAIKKIVGGYEFNSTAISYSIAPLINASCRMKQNHLAVEAFLADDNKQVLSLVKQLKACKEQQNNEIESMVEVVHSQCEEQKNNKMIVVEIDTEYGISGLIANKLAQEYQRPVLCVKHSDGLYAGSMRAVGVEDFRKICNDSGLARADGHESASGIVIKEDVMEQFRHYIEDNLVIDIKQEYEVDAVVCLGDITRYLVEKVKMIDRVSGTGFKPLKFFMDGIDEYDIGQFSNYKHLVIKPNDSFYIIKWNWNGSFDDMEESSAFNNEIKVVGTLDSGFFGRNFVLKIICDDIEVVN